MQYYTDIKIMQNPEIGPQVVLNMLFEKVHLILAEQKRTDVGVSFPGKNETGLGEILRVHGGLDVLQEFLEHRFVRVMRDYAEVGRVKKVPENASFCTVSRVQAKSSAERLRRRSMKRHGISAEEAAEKIPDSMEERLNLPFLTINSKSTGQKFRVYIKHCECSKSSHGDFSTYGLSSVATVPMF